MDETLGFFKELLRMTNLMVNDIMPDMLLHLDQGTLESLKNESQEANNSLQVFTKLCGIISRKNMSCSSVSLPPAEGPLGGAMSVHLSHPPQASSGGDNISIVSNFSDLSAHPDDVWKGLLTEARIWYLTQNKERPNVYYCGVCNKQAKANHIWEAHLGGKTHLKLLADVDAVKFVCGTCGLHICGTVELINDITSSEEHHAFDSICDSRHASPVRSVTSRCSSKVVSKKQEPEVSDTPEPSNIKPPTSGQSTKTNQSVASQSLKPEAQSTPKASKIVFQNTEIHNDFAQITDVISGYIDNHEPFAIGYCRPCEMICESKELWIDHKKTAKHRGKMGSKHYNNVLCRCLQCEFVVAASLKIATTYMKYHIENCHHQSTEGIKIEEYMELKNLGLPAKTTKKEPESKESSFKGSIETICSLRSSVTDLQSSLADMGDSSSVPLSSDDLRFRLNALHSGPKIPLPDAPRDVGHYAEQSTSASSSSLSTGAAQKTSANPYKSSNAAQVSDVDSPAQINHSAQNGAPSAQNGAPSTLADLEFTFLQMLFKKEESFQKDTTVKLFTALCAVCNRANFSSENAWNHHVLSHGHYGQLNNAKEIACSQCHTRFFGVVGDIDPFINHDYHVCIDAMFSW